MTPDRALARGVDAADVRVTCDASRHGGKWIAWVPDARRPHGEYVLTDSPSPWEVAQWRGRLERLAKKFHEKP